MIQLKPDHEAFARIADLVENHHHYLTLKDIVDVFGWPATELLILLVLPERSNAEVVKLLEEIKNK